LPWKLFRSFLVSRFCALIAGGQSTRFEAKLSGKNQSPAIGTAAHGEATFRLSSDGKSLSYSLSIMDIENVSMAHIHLGPADEEGPVAAWLYPSKPPAVVKERKSTGVLARGSILRRISRAARGKNHR
jgi:hypothetical protein